MDVGTVHPFVAARRDRITFAAMAGPVSDWPRLKEAVLEIEDLGFDSYWMLDHPVREADCWTNLAALAITTRRLRLGSMVSCVHYRSPANLARLAADVDRLSEGRLILGVGIGWDEKEFGQLGTAFPSTRERLEALDETVQIVRGLWGGAPFTFHGKHYRIVEGEIRPGPVQQPRVPILIAGSGERVTFRQVARHADLSNFGEFQSVGAVRDADDVRQKLAALRARCTEQSRPFESILRTHLTLPLVLAPGRAALDAKLNALPPYFADLYRRANLPGTPAEAIAYYGALATAGLQYFIARIVGNDVESLRILVREVIPEVAGKATPS